MKSWMRPSVFFGLLGVSACACSSGSPWQGERFEEAATDTVATDTAWADAVLESEAALASRRSALTAADAGADAGDAGRR